MAGPLLEQAGGQQKGGAVLPGGGGVREEQGDGRQGMAGGQAGKEPGGAFMCGGGARRAGRGVLQVRFRRRRREGQQDWAGTCHMFMTRTSCSWLITRDSDTNSTCPDFTRPALPWSCYFSLAPPPLPCSCVHPPCPALAAHFLRPSPAALSLPLMFQPCPCRIVPAAHLFGPCPVPAA